MGWGPGFKKNSMKKRVFIQFKIIGLNQFLELMHSWGFALREGVFTESKEGICRNKD